MSACNRNPEDNFNNSRDREPIKEINVNSSSIQTNNSNASHPSIIRRTKKNKTRMPKDAIFKDEEEDILPNKDKEKKLSNFEQLLNEKINKNDNNDEKSDPLEFSVDKDDEEKDKNKKVEIINTDTPLNRQEKNISLNEPKTSEILNDINIKDEIEKNEENNNKEELKEEKNNDNNDIDKINNEEEKKENKNEEKEVNEENLEKEEKEENKVKEENEVKKENLEKKGNEVKEENLEKKENEVKEEHLEKEEEVKEEIIEKKKDDKIDNIELDKNENKDNNFEEKKNLEIDEKKEEKEIKEEHIEKEEEKNENGKDEEKNDKNNEKNDNEKKAEIKVEEISNEKNEENKEKNKNIEKREYSYRNRFLRNRPKRYEKKEELSKEKVEEKKDKQEEKGEEKEIKEEVKNKEKNENVLKEERKKENEQVLKEDEKQKEEGEKNEGEEEENNQNDKNSENKEEKIEETKGTEEDFLKKYENLVSIININLEAKGFEKVDIKKEIDELYNSFSDSTPSEELISNLSDLLIKLMEVTLDSDKTEIKDFCKELIIFYNGDKNRIYNQLMNFIENIEEQIKLTTRKLNRSMRSYIRDAEDKLRPRLKQEDIPANKIISYELFNSIVEECEIQLKEGYMDVLLYQMKKQVPKGKGFNTLNAIVIVDFLK